MQLLSVLMPVYNESRTLRTVIQRVLAAPVDISIELVAVDDASRDTSLEILRTLASTDDRIKVVAHPDNRGKGAAIRTAIERMTGDVAIIQDADLEYDPADYPKVLAPILAGRADAVYGSRFAASPERRVSFWWHRMGNQVLTQLSNIANDLDLTDMETCYKAVRTDLLRKLRLTTDRFGIEPEITARLAQWGARIYEVPISYHGRSYAEGKNIGWRDALQAVWLIFKFRILDTRFTTDPVYQRLRVLSRVQAVNRWRFEQVAPHIGDRVLEVGAGLGAVTQQLIDRPEVVCVEPNREHAQLLKRRLGHLENVDVVSGPVEKLEEVLSDQVSQSFDTVISFNLLETLEDDAGAITRMLNVLEPNGRLVLLVSAHPHLMSDADRMLGRRRRYEASTLAETLRRAGAENVEIREFNRFGALGWMLSRRLGGGEPTSGQVTLFALLLPVARLVERIERLPGLNFVVAARRG